MTESQPAQFARYLEGKRVVLVGPAGYLEGKRRGEWIDSFDVVAKLNWGETLPAEDYGRTDVLFKRLLKLGHADESLVQEYLEADLKWLVAVETRANGARKQLLERLLGRRLKWFIDARSRAATMNEMSSAPLLGMIAVRMLLELKVASVTITGCDFYASGYSADYGGKPYRREMARREGVIGSRHNGPEQLKWLIRQRAQDDRLVFDDVLEGLAAAATAAATSTSVQIAPSRRKKRKAPKPTAAAPQRPQRPPARPGAPPARPPARFTWSAANVSAVNPAAMAIRTFLEHRQLRQILEDVGQLETAAEIGAGFGRMGQQLAELADRVTLYEREPELVAQARRLLPDVDVVQVDRLGELPGEARSQDLVMAFTVLQHMSDEEAGAAIREMDRLARSWVLIVEDTDPDYRRRFNDRTHFTNGRAVEWYAGALGPGFKLEAGTPREVEPGYKGQSPAYVGHYLLFRRLPE